MDNDQSPSAEPISGQPASPAPSPDTKQIPTGVKTIAVLHYIAAAVYILIGVAVFFGKSIITELSVGGFSATASVVFYIIAIFMISIGVLDIFIGMGLWKGKNWARITAIVLSSIGFLLSFTNLSQPGGKFSAIIAILIYGSIVGYLLLSKQVKSAFA